MAGSAKSSTPLKRKHLGESKTQTKRQRGIINEAIVDRTVVTSKQQDVSVTTAAQAQPEWMVSKPAGGRMVDVDPVLTEDQRFLIVPYTTSIQIYSTADSLLVRRIPITTSNRNAGVVALRQSLIDPEVIWVSCANGSIFKLNWSVEAEDATILTTTTQSGSSTGLSTLLLSVGAKKTATEVVIVAEAANDDLQTRISVYDSELNFSKALLELAPGISRFHTLSALSEVGLLYASAGKRLYIGSPKSLEVETLEALAYDFYNFACQDLVTATDARITQPTRSKKGAKQQDKVIDIAVGCARGPIYFYSDILSRLQALEQSKTPKEAIQAKKMHWHRRAVHAVKWSRDGNYLVSGGSEHTLVLWQLDTNKQSFLPHLTGIIENIVISASGTAYAVHLDDNSVMVLSSAELVPTTYISGIQSAVYTSNTLKDHLIPRIGENYKFDDIDVVSALSPSSPDKLYICVGDGLQATRNGSKPYLQTVDLSSMRSIGKQAIARSSLTVNNATPAGGVIVDPEVKHMAFSSDGKWLATVDEWVPPSNSQTDLGNGEDDSELRHGRREVFLKIWDAEAPEGENADASFALVSRINSPHETSNPEGVLDLASDPLNARFATLGRDGVVHIWKARPRQRDGLAVTDDRGKELHTWVCELSVTVNHRQSTLALHGIDWARIEGRLSFSDDGSCLVAAFGAGDQGSIYVIDAHTGEVRYAWDDLWRGSLHGLQLLGPYVIVLSHDLRVFDMVSDSLLYGLPLTKTTNLDSATGAANLAIDRVSRHFAVSFRHAAGSELLVFSPESMEPLLSHHFDSRIASLSASVEPHTSGFLVLDDEAQVFTVYQPSNDAALVVARSLDDMQLDVTEEEPVSLVNGEILDVSDDEEEIEAETAGNAMEIDGDDEETSAHPVVISHHQLADIFDAAPAYAMAPMEDIFRKVASLLANKPAAAGSS
ncbi:hypothetical protein TD95_005276 [Thielaviopsis punctulata]|uniref:Uncharacterized protein n=1 Tax=Thielaviopsis punctulata TaxID=72032 RepID=A0A0F4ZGD5_9PEZI|nr:hypothetical protein TD95_005276 [Thielaviopsis punctulata]